MSDENTPEDAVVETEEKEEESSPEETIADDGKGEGEAEAPVETKYRDQSALFKEKGWDDKTGAEQLVKSYQDLESKLGNWKDTEQKAADYDGLKTEHETALEKAEAWDKAQKYLDNLEQTGQVGNIDLSRTPTDKLAQLWKSGNLSITDLPKERQYEVQRFVQTQDSAIERQSADQAKQLAEKYPILKDAAVAGIVADQIEKGVIDPKTGRELNPEQIVERVKGMIEKAEKTGEERIKKDTEMLKKGNLERTDSAVNTKPINKVKTIHDAFKAAKREMEEA